MTEDLNSATPGQASAERSGLSAGALTEVLTALLDGYGAEDGAQRRALEAALGVLNAQDAVAQSKDGDLFETREEIAADALESFAQQLQDESGFLLKDAPGVAEARSEAMRLRAMEPKSFVSADDVPRELKAQIGASVLRAFADGLQQLSGFTTVNAPGVDDARMFADSLLETAQLIPGAGGRP